MPTPHREMLLGRKKQREEEMLIEYVDNGEEGNLADRLVLKKQKTVVMLDSVSEIRRRMLRRWSQHRRAHTGSAKIRTNRHPSKNQRGRSTCSRRRSVPVSSL